MSESIEFTIKGGRLSESDMEEWVQALDELIDNSKWVDMGYTTYNFERKGKGWFYAPYDYDFDKAVDVLVSCGFKYRVTIFGRKFEADPVQSLSKLRDYSK